MVFKIAWYFPNWPKARVVMIAKVMGRMLMISTIWYFVASMANPLMSSTWKTTVPISFSIKKYKNITNWFDMVSFCIENDINPNFSTIFYFLVTLSLFYDLNSLVIWKIYLNILKSYIFYIQKRMKSIKYSFDCIFQWTTSNISFQGNFCVKQI